MAGRRDTQSRMEPSSDTDMLETLCSIIRGSGTRGVRLRDLLREYERLTGVPQGNVKQRFTPQSLVVLLETETGISYEPLGSSEFRLFWTMSPQPEPPAVPTSVTASVLKESSPATPPCTSAPPTCFRQQEGLSEEAYVPVYVPHVNSVGDFYVQLRGNDTSVRLEELMINLEVEYEGGTSKAFLMDELVEGMPCAALFSYADGSSDWHRAVITSLHCEPHLCRVFYVDYGTRGSVERTSLRRLKSEFFELPAQAIRASLACVEPMTPSGWTAESTAFFRQLVSEDKVFMCKLVGPRRADKCNVALCDVDQTPEVFVSELLVERGHAVPLDDTDHETPDMLPHPAFPVPKGTGAAGKPPRRVRSTFRRGRAPPPATAAPVRCTVNTAAVQGTAASMLMRVDHFRPSDYDTVQRPAVGGAPEPFGAPAEQQRPMLALPPPARRAQRAAPSSRPAVQPECEDVEPWAAALPCARPFPSRQPVPVAHAAQPRFRPPAQVHKPPVPAATRPHGVSAVALGVALPAAVGPAAQSSVHASAAFQVASVGGTAAPVGAQQEDDDDVMVALKEALDEEESCLAVYVEQLSTGHQLRVLHHSGVPYISADEVCELLCWPHGQLQHVLVARDSDFPSLFTVRREDNGQLFEQMAHLGVPGLHASTLALDFVKLQDVLVVLNVFGSGVALRPVKDEVRRVLESL